MLSKFSVKKPLTVFVAVILILVFGFVSFNKMVPDLYPNIDLPYVAVITAAPGATPEEVEKRVTLPMEQQMSTLEGLDNITSTSGENYSMIMLEFNSDADLSVVSVDIRDKIDLVSGSFGEDIQKPIIFKLNPNIIPTTIAAVDMDGKSTAEVSAFVEDDLMRKLEGVDGVASVNGAGLVTNTIHIELDQEKVEALNLDVKNALQAQTDEARSAVNSGIAQAEQGSAQIQQGKSQIQAAQQAMAVQEEMVTSTLENLMLLLLQRDALAQIGDAEGAQRVQGNIDLLLDGLRPYSGELSALGVDLNTVATDYNSVNLAMSNFNISMSVSSSQLSNQMSELSATDAYLKGMKLQLESSLQQIDAAAATSVNAANVDSIITAQNLSKILAAQNFSMPAGSISEDGNSVLVSVGDEIKDPEELKNLVILDPNVPGIDPIRVKDVATVNYMNNGEDTYGKINGKDGVLLSIHKQSDYSTSLMASNVQDEFRSLEKEYKGLKFTTLTNQGEYINIVIDSVLSNLLMGAILAFIILLFFLRDLKPTLITALSIPISVTFALALMYFTGVTLNVISLSGLAVGVGMLVDNSIVVIENIYRLRNLGYSKIQAAIKGASQVSGAITASTLTTICVFFPIVFVDGITRELFVDMALTVTYSLLASLFIALTMVPALGRALLSKTNKLTVMGPESKTIDRYKKGMAFVLSHRALVLIVVLVLFGGSLGLTLVKGFTFMPSMALAEITATATMPQDYTKADTIKAGDALMEEIGDMKEVETVGIMLTSDTNSIMGFDVSGKDWGSLDIFVRLKESEIKNSEKVSNRIEKLGKDAGMEMMVSGSTDAANAMGATGIVVNVYSDDLDELRTWTRNIEEELATVEGVKDISDSSKGTIPEIKISLDKNKAMESGLTVAQVYGEVSAALDQGSAATSMMYDGGDRDVVVSNTKTKTITKESLADLKISSQDMATGQRSEVRLGDIATISEDTSLASIQHKDQRRSIPVRAGIEEEYNTTLVNKDVEETIGKMDLPPGVDVEFDGESEQIMDAMMQLLQMLLLGMLMIYLVMVAQFQSLLSPFIVMFTVPLAFTGGLLALLITGFEISVVSMIGFIVLMGVIVNNAIVLIDYINQLVREGMEKREAIILGSATRTRPVLMTALTTVLGLLPLAFGMGSGAEMMQPVAIVCIGGLLYATLMTLVVIPVLYDLFHRKKINFISEEELTMNEA